MKKILRVALTGLWLIVASVLLTRWWRTSPSAAFIPDFPDAFWIWLSELSGVEGAESLADLGTLIVLTLSFIVVSTLTLVVWFLWRRIQNALTSRSSGRAKARR